MSTQALPLEKAAPDRRVSLRAGLRDYGMLLSLVVIMAFFQIATGGTLLRPLNLTNLILQNSFIVIMALGMLLVIVTGHIDLSVGSVAGAVGAIAAVLIVRLGVPPVPAVLPSSASTTLPVTPAAFKRGPNAASPTS